MDKRKISIILSTIFVYIFFAGVSYILFSSPAISQKVALTSPLSSPSKTSEGRLIFDSTLPKTESCPLNGELYSKTQKDWWEMHRPLGVMIENHQDSRPQSGLSFADVVYEAVAEGGITRFLAVFYCQDAGIIGPVRSARTYYLDWISEYGKYPLYTHVGGANQPGIADALSQITDYGWAGYNDLNQFSVGFPTFWRDYDRLGHTTATEHTMYSTTQKLWELAKSRGLSNVDKEGVSWNEKFLPYTFKDDALVGERPANQVVHLEFWSGYSDYFVDFDYDSKANLYKRSNKGVPQVDKDNNKQLTAKNIIVLFMREDNANDGYENNIHLLYENVGSGKALVFMDGKKIPATWKKDSRIARTLIFESNGSPVKFNKGTIWFEILPTDGVVSVK